MKENVGVNPIVLLLENHVNGLLNTGKRITNLSLFHSTFLSFLNRTSKFHSCTAAELDALSVKMLNNKTTKDLLDHSSFCFINTSRIPLFQLADFNKSLTQNTEEYVN
jgi:hypothetical protein